MLAAGSDGETVVIGGNYTDVRTPMKFDNRNSSDPDVIVMNDAAGPGSDLYIGPQRVRMERPTSSGGRMSELRDDRIAVGPIGGDPTTIRGSGITTTGRIDCHGFESKVKGVRAAINASSSEGRAVNAVSTLGVGIRAKGFERGGTFFGRRAQVRLLPFNRRTHPKKGQMGDLFVDKKGRLWYCVGGTQWRKLAS